MTTLEELKKNWEATEAYPVQPAYDRAGLEKICKRRVNKHLNAAMQYFWASFTMQILVYALLSHVIIRYWPDPEMLGLSLGGMLLYFPFTFLLLKKFKGMATTRVTEENNLGSALQAYVIRQHALLQGFYRFKKWYEFILIPLSAVIGIFLTFKLFVPGGVSENPNGAAITFAITMISCVLAIRSENKKSFEQPIHDMTGILAEFKSEDSR